MEKITGRVPVLFDEQLLAERIGQTVTLQGQIQRIRLMSGFAFVLLRANRRVLQCVQSPEWSEFAIEELAENMAVSFTGRVVAEERSRAGYEIRLLTCEILGRPAAEPPVVIHNKEVDAALETKLDYRPLTLRHPRERAVFQIQAGLCRGLRGFLEENGFTEIHTPKLVFAGAEGGANLFRLDYFGREAFLTQSPQFYKQMMVGVFGRVYEIAPVFRAEKHDTSRHINEYTSVDLEMGFVRDFRQLMELETAMLRQAFQFLRENYAEELEMLSAKLPQVETIPAIPFLEAKEWVARAYDTPVTDWGDFDPEEEKRLGELILRKTGSELVFVTHYLSSKRPFYALDSAEDPSLTDSFDLLFRGLEVTTGGLRIHDYQRQVAKMEALGMDVSAFASYLQAHLYGLPPHGGMGIGLERLTARLLNFANVRQATLFPRDIHRLEP